MAATNFPNLPGVKINEVMLGSPPIVGVGTSTAGFVGLAPNPNRYRNVARMVTSADQFTMDYIWAVDQVGNHDETADANLSTDLSRAVFGFFSNGGTACYVVNVSDAIRATGTITFSANPDPGSTINLGGTIWKFIDTGTPGTPGATETVIGTNLLATLTTLAGNLNASTDKNIRRCAYTINAIGDTLTITFKSAGITGNSFTLAVPTSNGAAPEKTLKNGSESAKATGVINFGKNPDPGSTIILGGTTWNFIGTGTPGAAETVIGATLGDTLRRLAENLNDPGDENINKCVYEVDPTTDPTTLTITFKSVGSTGNSFTLAAPKTNASTLTGSLANGQDTSSGNTLVSQGLKQFEQLNDISIIAAPGFTSKDVYTALQSQAEALGDRFAILDSNDFDPLSSSGPPDSSYSAFYYPRVKVGKQLDSDPPEDVVPPSGHIAGIYARVDYSRGVHKAPANEVLRGVLGLKEPVTDDQQNQMNDVGINVLRLFSGNVVVWGARTVLADKSDIRFRYINVRRLLIYIEQSLKVGLRWAVFEPNNLTLQKQITRSVRAFLDGVWRDGGLYGATPDEAYYVRFPEMYNRDDDRAQGKLTVEIGVRVSYPAEFIIIRIGLLMQNAATA